MRKPSQRNSTRDREKAERMALRSLVAELETLLTALSRGEMQFTRSQLQSIQSGKSAWRSLAERQTRARQKAEQTNRALNDQVQSNADWIQRLWELLYEKRRAAEGSSLRTMAAPQRKAEDNFVLDQLKQQTHTAVTELPYVFTAQGVRVLDGSADMVDVWNHRQTGDMESTLVCVRRVPFDLHSTSNAVWTALSRPEGSYASESNLGATPHDLTLKARVVERTVNVCAMKVQDKILLGSKAEIVDYHAVVRRGKLHGTSVYVWTSLFTLTDGSVRYEDTMWAAVARCPSGILESIVAVVSQSQLQVNGKLNGSVSLQASIMPAVEGCVDSMLSSTESMLLSESLSGSSRSSSSNSADEASESITV